MGSFAPIRPSIIAIAVPSLALSRRRVALFCEFPRFTPVASLPIWQEWLRSRDSLPPGSTGLASFARFLPDGGESVASFARFPSRFRLDPSAIPAELGLFRAFVYRPVGLAGPVPPET